METKKTSKAIVWTSYILQGIIVLMFLMGVFMNLSQNEEAIKGGIEMGYPKEAMLYLGIVQLIAVILYAIPRTVIFGAILITGWLSGAVATHVIHRDPLFNILFPVIFGIIVWGSIWLRNEKLKALLSNK
ncbi:DoxX family protein [Flavobacterium sp. UMI-01]|uniref:DoxX family protein n=1 Tax=Flavobacterium sp. UMI-01 TaxID=1441053 RepID=UPI001C7D18F3|nr:DoxX family protein [Flavobacterium sp. UMI-01]GIZ08157.1 membrane protein [Flavobacterium sp. UMI-01]